MDTMHASLIQHYPKMDRHDSSTSSNKKYTTRNEQSFQKQLKDELSPKSQAHPKSDPVKSKEHDETVWLAGMQIGPIQTEQENRITKTRETNPTLSNRKDQELSATRQTHGSDEPDNMPRTSDSSKTESGKNNGAGKAENSDNPPGGKNVTASEIETQREAKSATRPTLHGKIPLTYGTVKTSETMLLNAGSAASTSVQTIPIHHGTPHASGDLQPNEHTIHQSSKDQNPMSTNATKNLTRTKEGPFEAAAFSVTARETAKLGSSESSSFSNSFSGNEKEDSSLFSGRDSGNTAHIQSTLKPQFGIPSNSAAMVDSIRKMQSMVQDQVVIMRNVPGQSMQVMIRPDANMALFLTLHQGESEVSVAARMDQATSNLLKPYWEEIQKELSQQGIRLGNPELNARQDSSSRHENPQDDKEHESQNMLSNRSQISDPRAETIKGSIHVLDSDFENAEGTLVSWA